MIDDQSHDRVVACRCVCGTEKVLYWTNLRRGTTTNCGCQRQAWNRSHGESGTPLYVAWGGMIQRCEDQNSRLYRHYGGRGIRVCPGWRSSYEAFAQWARSNGWRQGLEIDRIDNDGPYEPANCRIADRKTQMRNTRVNRILAAWGETKVMAAWADDPRCVVDYACLVNRIHRGWTVEDALTRPKRTTSMTCT